jgi:hypothetical protein
VTDAGFDEWLDALADDEGYYLSCPEGHGSLPPRRTCPHCGSQELTEEPLPAVGEVATYTVVHVASPAFADEAPYVNAVVSFGPVRLTGVVREVDPEAVETGTTVEPAVGHNRETGQRLLTFRVR